MALIFSLIQVWKNIICTQWFEKWYSFLKNYRIILFEDMFYYNTWKGLGNFNLDSYSMSASIFFLKLKWLGKLSILVHLAQDGVSEILHFETSKYHLEHPSIRKRYESSHGKPHLQGVVNTELGRLFGNPHFLNHCKTDCLGLYRFCNFEAWHTILLSVHFQYSITYIEFQKKIGTFGKCCSFYKSMVVIRCGEFMYFAD